MKKNMKKIFHSAFFSLYWSIVIIAQPNQAVTPVGGGPAGRFGDKIVHYTVAKFISYRFNIPLLVKPFKYSSMLRFGREEKKYSREVVKQFKGGVIPISKEEDIIAHAKDNVIFETGNFRVDGCPNRTQTMEYILKDQHFIVELRNMLQPVVPLPRITLPTDKVTVAVHIRKGGGYDAPLNSIQYYLKQYADQRWPFKFPPEQYYVDQIKRISTLFDDVPLFMHIFTDDRNPSKLLNRIKKAVNKENITFSCRKIGNAHKIKYLISLFDYQ